MRNQKILLLSQPTEKRLSGSKSSDSYDFKQRGRAKFIIFVLIILYIVLTSCSKEVKKRFTLVASSHTNIEFVNQVKDTPAFNIFNYYNFYNGGGVAAGDINNDGLSDLFFVGNDTNNRLYLNKGDFQFKDITESANISGIEGSWSTGVTMVDINSDRYLDIYVSHVNYHNKSGSNQLFINNKDGTFTDRAKEYGLNFKGYSTQAIFIDYNNDDRLDMYLLNQSFPSKKIFGAADSIRKKNAPKAGDKLFRNDGGIFQDVTEEAGIYSSALGLGLGVAASDINRDGWIDIYIGNDAHEDDYLYINNGDGTFSEALSASLNHTSRSSMGNEIADFNNDGKVDIISVDMMPKDRETYMSSGGPSLYLVYQKYLDLGYGHQNERNTLQLNRGNAPDGTPLFSDIAFSAEIARTSWSWAPLFFDMNNDSYKDLYVSNGMVRRTNNLDATRKREVKVARSGEDSEFANQEKLVSALKEMPQERIPNYTFKNNGDLTFADKTEEWGLAQPSISSGAAYVDLDNDGDLDLVANNTNMTPFIYSNNTTEKDNNTHFLKIQLKGKKGNTFGIGSKVVAYKGKNLFYQEQVPTRGFQSSVDYTLHFGMGAVQQLDSLCVIWPDHRYQILRDVKTDQLLELNQEEASGRFNYNTLNSKWQRSRFQDVSESYDLSYHHKESEFNDFQMEPLMPFRLSTQGPALSVGDITGDGLDDFFVGGAKGQAGKLFIQQQNGSFTSSNEKIFGKDRQKEDVDATFFDADVDGDLDLYVVSGGSEFTGYENTSKDRLYINDGRGNFGKSSNRLPEVTGNGSVVAEADYDGDGDVDLFIGVRSIPGLYGLNPRSYLLENNNGNFKDITEQVAPALKNIGMITDAEWAYISNKQYPDLIIAGEWMPIQFFKNNGSALTKNTKELGLADKSGLWQEILIADLNSDSYLDIVAGNFGTNSRFQVSDKMPLRLYINDFTGDGQITPIIAEKVNGDYYPYEQLHELLMELKFLVRRVKSYRDYSSQTMLELFGQEAISSSQIKDINELSSLIFMNEENQTFLSSQLPIEAQFSPIMAMTIIGKSNTAKELLIGGNLYNVKQSIGGRQDASYGLQITVTNNSLVTSELQESGFYVNGEIREIKRIKVGSEKLIMVAVNNGRIKFFKNRDYHQKQ